MKVVIKEKQEGSWVVIPSSNEQTILWQQIKDSIGLERAIEITTKHISTTGQPYEIKEYYCGTKDIFESVKKVKLSTNNSCVMTSEDACLAHECDPEKFNFIVRTFFGKEDVERAFPEKPVIKDIPAKGWDHLKEEVNAESSTK